MKDIWLCFYLDEMSISLHEIEASSIDDAINIHRIRHGVKPVIALLLQKTTPAVYSLLNEKWGVLAIDHVTDENNSSAADKWRKIS